MEGGYTSIIKGSKVSGSHPQGIASGTGGGGISSARPRRRRESFDSLLLRTFCWRALDEAL